MIRWKIFASASELNVFCNALRNWCSLSQISIKKFYVDHIGLKSDFYSCYTLKMNKLRQAGITTELIEVVSGAESLNN